MATVTERLAFMVSLDADQAVRGFEKIGSSADQNLSKLQRGSQAVFNTMKAHALEFAAAGGAAVLGFAVKGVNAFQDLALEAGKFSDATGVAVDDASRWIEVADDLGVSSESVQGAIQRMNKSIADGKLDEFADQIVRAKDGTVDANATFQRLITTIGAIPDPTERAKAAQEAFGRGYAEIAELMEMSATDLAAALGNVSDAKVIDEGELKKARDFRAAMDELSDKVGDAALRIGGALVPVLITAAEKIEALSSGASKVDQLGRVVGSEGLAGKLGQLYDEFVPLDNIASGLGRTFSGDSSAAERLGGAIEFLAGGVPILGERISALNDNELDLALSAELVNEALRGGADDYIEFAAAMSGANDNVVNFDSSLVDMGDAADDTKRKIEQLQGGVELLQGALSNRDAFDAAVQGWDEVLWAATVAQNAEAAGAGNAAELRAEANDKIRESIDTTLAYIATVGGIPASQTTEIEALIDQGRYAEVESMLQQLARRRTATIEALGTYLGRERRAAGGPVSAGRSYLVGEQGPELVTFGANGFVTPNHALGSPQLRANAVSAASNGGGNNYYLSVYPPVTMASSDVGKVLIDSIREFERVGGTAWRRA